MFIYYGALRTNMATKTTRLDHPKLHKPITELFVAVAIRTVDFLSDFSLKDIPDSLHNWKRIDQWFSEELRPVAPL